jgi:soluble lytic murein transglycosylase-like protein
MKCRCFEEWKTAFSFEAARQNRCEEQGRDAGLASKRASVLMRFRFAAYAGFMALTLASPVAAEEAKTDYSTAEALCVLIEKAAEDHGLPKPFFARLIWKESRFDIRAVSPVGAQGVAQFMPATAKRRSLKHPFDPVQAIPRVGNDSCDKQPHGKECGYWGAVMRTATTQSSQKSLNRSLESSV